MIILKVRRLKSKHIMGLRRNLTKEAEVRNLHLFLDGLAPTDDWCDVAQATIDILPDLALLEMVSFLIHEPRTGAWCTLVHVCRRWRSLIFGSPRRLDLQLYCGVTTPVRETLDVWPPLPISISVCNPKKWVEDNIVAALEHNDRISEILLSHIPNSRFQRVLAAMQKPLPAMTRLELTLFGSDETMPVFPATFLGGAALRLRTLILGSIPFPGLPNLLLSATHLVHLRLLKIPDSGYFPPETMVTCLSVLTRLERLDIGFQSAESRPDRKNRRPDRILLPVLTMLGFSGSSDYLDDLVAEIDATFFHEFDTSQLSQFIGRTPKLNVIDEAYVVFSSYHVLITFPQPFGGALSLAIRYSSSDWQLFSLAHVCRSSFPQALIPSVERLYILEDAISCPRWQNDIESSQWLELLHPFTAVKDLYISREFVPRIAPTLQDLIGESVTEALPALQSLFLEEALPPEPIQEGIRQFVAARQLTGHPVSIYHWEGKRINWEMSRDR
jgi:hypothetical protein